MSLWARRFPIPALRSVALRSGVRAATGDVNRARLREELGFELGARAEAGVSDEGAWFATAPNGAPVVLKWFPDETVAERYAVLLPGLDELRSRGVPVRAGARDHLGHVTRVTDASRWRSGPSPANRPSA